MRSKSLEGLKLLCAAAVLSMVAQVSSAYIVVNWTASRLIDQEDVRLDNTLIQLIWSSDGVMDPLGLAIGPTADPVGNDYLLDWNWTGSGHLDAEGSPEPKSIGRAGLFNAEYDYTDLSGNSDGSLVTLNQFLQGSLYVRVFGAYDPGPEDWYYQGALTAGPHINNPSDPSQYTTLTYNDAQLDMQLVPEPTTITLFGIGLATLAVRRRKRR